MTLEERLAAFRSKFLSEVPEEIQQLMRGAATRLEESGATLCAAKAGDEAHRTDGAPNSHQRVAAPRTSPP